MKNRKRFLLSLTALVIILTQNTLSQQPVNGVVKVIFSPDHKDWLYKLNEEAGFSVQVLK